MLQKINIVHFLYQLGDNGGGDNLADGNGQNNAGGVPSEGKNNPTAPYPPSNNGDGTKKDPKQN